MDKHKKERAAAKAVTRNIEKPVGMALSNNIGMPAIKNVISERMNIPNQAAMLPSE